MKSNFMVNIYKWVRNVSLPLPSMFPGPFLQSIREMNNLMPVRDYAFVNLLFPSDWYALVKEITTSVMRMVSLLNQLLSDSKEVLAPFILSWEAKSLRTRYNLIRG